MTEYILLERVESENDEGQIPTTTWTLYGRIAARSARSAIRESISNDPREPAGEFVAVPARSWRPVSVKVETKTALKFS